MILLLLSMFASGAELVDGIACVVNDDVVTLSDIYEGYAEVFEKQCGRGPLRRDLPCVKEIEAKAAENQVMIALVRQKLQESQMDVRDDQLERSIDNIMAEYNIGSREQLKLALAQQGIEWEAYRRQTRDQIRMMNFNQAFLAPKIRISEDEVRDRYQRAVREFLTESVLDLSYQLYPIPEGSDALDISALEAAIVARVGQVKARQVGLEAMGELRAVQPQFDKSQYKPSQLYDAFKAVTDLEVGEIGGPYRVGQSFFVIRLDSKESGRVQSYEEVRQKIEEQIFDERMDEEAARWFLKAKRNAAIRCPALD